MTDLHLVPLQGRTAYTTALKLRCLAIFFLIFSIFSHHALPQRRHAIRQNQNATWEPFGDDSYLALGFDGAAVSCRAAYVVLQAAALIRARRSALA
jgi:hypothetical protein